MARVVLNQDTMPDAGEITGALSRSAHAWFELAVAWHVVLGAAALAISKRWWFPSARALGMGACLLLASASIAAWLSDNPFNGVVLAIVCAALSSVALRLGTLRPELTPGWSKQLAAVLLAFAWLYPHFLEDRPGWHYVVGAPLGVLPCPSFAAVLAVGLWYGLFGSRAWGLTAASFALGYGLLGALYLGVWLDWVLVGGAALTMLGALALRPVERAQQQKRPRELRDVGSRLTRGARWVLRMEPRK